MGIAPFFEKAFFVFFEKISRETIKINPLGAVSVVFLPIM